MGSSTIGDTPRTRRNRFVAKYTVVTQIAKFLARAGRLDEGILKIRYGGIAALSRQRRTAWPRPAARGLSSFLKLSRRATKGPTNLIKISYLRVGRGNCRNDSRCHGRQVRKSPGAGCKDCRHLFAVLLCQTRTADWKSI